MSTDFYTANQLADRLQVSIRSVEAWTQARRVPGQFQVGRLWRYRAADVERRLLSGQFLLDCNNAKHCSRRRSGIFNLNNGGSYKRTR